MLENYVKSRKRIDQQLQPLLNFTSLLNQYKDCAGDEVFVEMAAIGEVNGMLHHHLQLITDALDEFLPLWEVMAVIEQDKMD